MSNQFLPTIMMPASDRQRLENLARAAAEQGDADALCLMGEINRAETVPDRAAQLDSIVTMGSWVTFWTNWGFPREKGNWCILTSTDPMRPKSQYCHRWARH